jgi:PadR family transcriptional regulator PadR
VPVARHGGPVALSRPHESALLTFDRNKSRLPFVSNDDKKMAQRATLLQGTLDLLILKALSTAELHGLGVSRRIEQMTGGTFAPQPGSLFPALHRLEEAGWLSSSWQPSENNRRAKYYTLTRAGRRQLGEEAAHWNRIALAIARALEA